MIQWAKIGAACNLTCFDDGAGDAYMKVNDEWGMVCYVQ